MKPDIIYIIAITGNDLHDAKMLFTEYANSLNVDLSFQDFEKELASIDKQYTHPFGGLLLAYNDNAAIACVGIRKINDDTAELKRMYVKPQYRCMGIGNELLHRSLELTQQLGYKKIRLDTLANMHKAQSLYLANGFIAIPPYRFNPLPGTIYMERVL